MIKLKKKDFSNFVSGLLKESMLTGIPQIVRARNVSKRVVRIFVLVACLIGFIYQSYSFMQVYWKYETVTDIKVTNPEKIDLPSMTVCNNNGFSMKRICADPKNDGVCVKLQDEPDLGFKWCDCMPRYCKKGKLKKLRLPTGNAMFDFNGVPYEDYKKYLITFNETFNNCILKMANDVDEEVQCDFSNYQNIRCTQGLYGLMNVCYTINTLIGRPDAKPQKVQSNGYMMMYLDPNQVEYHALIDTISMQVSFHHPREVINPYDQGFVVYPGQNYFFRMKKMVKHLLPAPYETDCIDYLEKWKSRGGRGPTNHRGCILECQKNVSLEVYGCVEFIFRGPGNERKCENFNKINPLLSKIRECTSLNCKPACYEEKYEVSKDSIVFSPGCKEDEYAEAYRKVVDVYLYFDGMETTTYTYRPKYENIEAFSYMGGYVGMWLGISLVAVFDFLETLVVVLKYPCERFLLHQSRSNRIKQLQRMPRNL